ncbi:small ribosomal subunit protein bS6m [Manis javanica]|uniref:small ribosomal subunit protein bS6m n=1 Tax=Manis javanica TaxID=9974 RepID=UPI003C6CF75E
MRPDPNMRAAAHILRLVPTPSRKGPREAAPAAERGQGSLRRRGKLGVRSGTPVRSSRLGEVPDPAATPPGSSISHRGPHRQGTAAERRARGADRTAAHAHTRAHARPLPRMKPKAWKVPAGLKAPETAAALKRTIEALMDRGAIVRNLENLGEQALPYKISTHSQQHSRGGYFLVDFYAPTTTVESIMDHLSRDIDVIRPNIVKHPLTQEVKECEGIVPIPLEEKLYSTKKRK